MIYRPIAFIALCAIIAIGIQAPKSTAISTNSTEENVSSNGSIEPDIQRLTVEKDKRRNTAESWDRWNIRCLFLAGLAATFLAVTAVGVSRSNSALIKASDELDKAKDAKLTMDLASKDIEITRATGLAGAANEKAGDANQRAGNAILRAAELEKEAAVARLETEKIKEVVAWRVLPVENASELEKILAANPGSVNLRYSDGDPESLYFTIQISQVLSQARWNVASGALKLTDTIVFGIVLPDANGADAETLRRAFSAAKISYSTNPFSSGPMFGFGISTIEGAPTLMVGSRRPPKLP